MIQTREQAVEEYGSDLAGVAPCRCCKEWSHEHAASECEKCGEFACPECVVSVPDRDLWFSRNLCAECRA
jgi:hypothetical protein